MNKKIIIYWVLAVVWMAWIFYLSSIPELASGLSTLYDIILRKLAHLTEYAILAILFFKGLQNKSRRDAIGVALVLAILYAVSDEWHQLFIFGRSGQPLDVLIDALGAVIGLLVITKIKKVRG